MDFGFASNDWAVRNMGRPVGSINRERPFADAPRLALRSGNPHRPRGIAERLIQKAEQGDLQAIKEVADRMDGLAAMVALISSILCAPQGREANSDLVLSV